MKAEEWFRPPRAVLTFFAALMTLCGLGLGWLGWQVVVQDRAVEAQQRQEQIEASADRATAALERVLASSDAQVTITASGEVRTAPRGRMAYVPAPPLPAPPSAELFAEGEHQEFAVQDLGKAAEVYRRLARSAEPCVRAQALVRLGRVLRKESFWADALQAYTELENLRVPVAGMPAGLVAAAARSSVLRASGDTPGAERASASVWRDLTGGKWSLTKPALETYIQELQTPGLGFPADWGERSALAGAAEWAYRQPAANGRAALVSGGRIASVVWERSGGTWTARVVGPSSWVAAWSALERGYGAGLRVTDLDGNVIHSAGPQSGQAIFRAAALTGLPWNITAFLPADGAWMAARRRFLIAGLGIFALVLGLGAFLIARAISRELDVSRLQSDFVAAVSHEFRTPLTSIRHLMEMLAAGRVETETQKQRAYELMLGQSDRLRRLVESLLDLGRMQARQYEFRSERLEAAEWSRSVAEEFQKSVRDRGYTIEFTGPAKRTWLRGDREALGGALWNLLDNAVKYSPDEKRVRVAVTCADRSIEVTVRDGGVGIMREDLKRVFARFYRGANARRQGAKGVGIGLAIVKEIVEAHGGAVRVRSEPGAGSEFTMVLPCES